MDSPTARNRIRRTDPFPSVDGAVEVVDDFSGVALISSASEFLRLELGRFKLSLTSSKTFPALFFNLNDNLCDYIHKNGRKTFELEYDCKFGHLLKSLGSNPMEK